MLAGALAVIAEPSDSTSQPPLLSPLAAQALSRGAGPTSQGPVPASHSDHLPSSTSITAAGTRAAAWADRTVGIGSLSAQGTSSADLSEPGPLQQQRSGLPQRSGRPGKLPTVGQPGEEDDLSARMAHIQV